jgi:hypothetical protein
MRSRLFSRRGGVWMLLAAMLTVVGGCGRSTTATGQVNYGGRPVAYGSVIFFGVDRAAHSGAIAPDGTYMVEGLSPGVYSIAVISRDPSRGRSTVRGHKPELLVRPTAARPTTASNGWFPLPSRLETAATSGLTCTLGSGRVMHHIDLK